MASKTIIALCVVIAVAAAVPALPAGPGWGPQAAGVNPWIPPWILAAPWMPKWTPCAVIGKTCLDCNTKLICTKMGQGLQRACSDPTLPHCNLGECSATPSAECAPPTPEQGPISVVVA